MMNSPVIYIVATPIGNLDDLTPRARRVLQEVDLIAAEDTRQARKLLSHLGIQGKRLVSYQDHGEARQAERLVGEVLAGGLSLAVVSDAGTPCVSDPGYRLVQAAKAQGITVHPVAGPSALTALVSASGLASDRLLFVGFLPAKPKALDAEIRSWRGVGASVVFFEATRRLGRTLAAIAQVYPEARVAVGRELTKLYEEIVTSSIADAQSWLASHPTLKGEATVMVELPRAAPEEAESPREDLLAMATREFAEGATLKELLGKYKDAGLRRAELYELLLEAKGRGD